MQHQFVSQVESLFVFLDNQIWGTFNVFKVESVVAQLPYVTQTTRLIQSSGT